VAVTGVLEPPLVVIGPRDCRWLATVVVDLVAPRLLRVDAIVG